MITIGSNIVLKGNGGLFKLSDEFGGFHSITDDQFIIRSFLSLFGDIIIEFNRIEKVIYARKILYPYILIVLSQKIKAETNITYIINPEKVLHYFREYGIPCIESKRSILRGFTDREIDQLN